jgi:hypothetical protein
MICTKTRESWKRGQRLGEGCIKDEMEEIGRDQNLLCINLYDKKAEFNFPKVTEVYQF